jgi:hypothetical protein
VDGVATLHGSQASGSAKLGIWLEYIHVKVFSGFGPARPGRFEVAETLGVLHVWYSPASDAEQRYFGRVVGVTRDWEGK